MFYRVNLITISLVTILGLVGCAAQQAGKVETKKKPVRADATLVVKGVTCPG